MWHQMDNCSICNKPISNSDRPLVTYKGWQIHESCYDLIDYEQDQSYQVETHIEYADESKPLSDEERRDFLATFTPNWERWLHVHPFAILADNMDLYSESSSILTYRNPQ